MIKVFEITPALSNQHNSTIVLASDTWENALDAAESSLDNQFLDEKPWSEIEVTIKCKMMSEEEFEELDNGYD